MKFAQTMSEKLEKIYIVSRIAIFAVPVIVLGYVVYLILFPVEKYSYYADQPELSKFSLLFSKSQNALAFGVFPLGNHRFIDLSFKLNPPSSGSCTETAFPLRIEKTYRAFLYPEGRPVSNEDELREYLFRDNGTKYPNGTLLHLTPTDEVYIVIGGKRTLFPGPEIFRAFGYSFDNLVDADKSTTDLFPEADDRVYLWTHSHPDGTIFQAYPSHKLYVIFGGEKHEIKDREMLMRIWPKNYQIAVSDPDIAAGQTCDILPADLKQGRISCRFDQRLIPTALGGYYNFSLQLPKNCTPDDLPIKQGEIKFISEKSYATIKDSLRAIFASILNRYIYPVPQI